MTTLAARLAGRAARSYLGDCPSRLALGSPGSAAPATPRTQVTGGLPSTTRCLRGWSRKSGPDEVAQTHEEPGVARLQHELLVAGRFEHREVVVVDDAMTRGDVLEGRVRLERTPVARSKLVDLAGRRSCGDRRCRPASSRTACWARDADRGLVSGRPSSCRSRRSRRGEGAGVELRDGVSVVARETVSPGLSAHVRRSPAGTSGLRRLVGFDVGCHRPKHRSRLLSSRRCSYPVQAVVKGSFQR